MNKLNAQIRRIAAAAAVASLAVTSSAHAAGGIDVAALVTDIGAQAAPVGLVGVAVLMIYGGVKAFKWVRSAMS